MTSVVGKLAVLLVCVFAVNSVAQVTVPSVDTVNECPTGIPDGFTAFSTVTIDNGGPSSITIQSINAGDYSLASGYTALIYQSVDSPFSLFVDCVYPTTTASN